MPFASQRAMALVFASIALLASTATAQASRLIDTAQVVELSLTSRIFNSTRAIRVYLPPGYNDRDTSRRYPVLYFNDGFAVFSSRAWGAPRTLDSLIRSQSIPPMIVVGIDNAASITGVADPARARANEYLPYPDSTEPDLANPEGGKYPTFLVDEVMPLIARSFRVLDGAANTGVAGSSYGGIAALTSVLRFPGKFGVLLMESTPLFLFHERLLQESRSLSAWPGAVYVGIGTHETDDPAIARLAGDSLMLRFISIVKDQSPNTRVRLYTVEGATHTSAAWGARLPTALKFLYGRTDP